MAAVLVAMVALVATVAGITATEVTAATAAGMETEAPAAMARELAAAGTQVMAPGVGMAVTAENSAAAVTEEAAATPVGTVAPVEMALPTWVLPVEVAAGEAPAPHPMETVGPEVWVGTDSVVVPAVRVETAARAAEPATAGEAATAETVPTTATVVAAETAALPPVVQAVLAAMAEPVEARPATGVTEEEAETHLADLAVMAAPVGMAVPAGTEDRAGRPARGIPTVPPAPAAPRRSLSA